MQELRGNAEIPLSGNFNRGRFYSNATEESLGTALAGYTAERDQWDPSLRLLFTSPLVAGTHGSTRRSHVSSSYDT
ncbi:hypothetical protein SRHO_G00127650 [Serrasalmus rhombeus]